MSATAPARGKASGVGTVLRVTSGNFLEMFDFFLFGFYATYISRAFFPAGSEFASLMLTFMTFGAGFPRCKREPRGKGGWFRESG
jgi:MHS family citrate/tricarballylate:H+ symporter-like MFS transporter